MIAIPPKTPPIIAPIGGLWEAFMSFVPERLLSAVELELVPDVTVETVLPLLVLPLKLAASDAPGVAAIAIPVWETPRLLDKPVDDCTPVGRLLEVVEPEEDEPVLLLVVDNDGG